MNLFKSIFSSGSGSTNTVDAAGAQALIKSGQPPFILDVRQPDEYRSGHIAGAVLIPLDELSSRAHELPKDKTILCVCRSGSRSASATASLKHAGFDAVNLRGGMIGWQMARLPVKKGK